jgi:hypothetical protein
MKKTSILTLAFLLSIPTYTKAFDQAYEQQLIARVKSVFAENQKVLKPSVDTLPPLKCAMSILTEAKMKFDSLSPKTQSLLKGYLSRPSLSGAKTYDSPSGYFKIHYATIGSDTVYQASVDTNPADGVPDYVNKCGQIFDSVLYFETVTLGYQSPPTDGTGGGDSRYDVYLMALSNVFGYTQPEQPSPYPSYTSYIVLDNDYIGFGYPNVLDPLRVTAAHEFFHAIQFGYDIEEFDKYYWMEISSVWMEDMAYDYVNDYLNYLRYFFSKPWVSLESTTDPIHPYGSCVWAFFLQERFDTTIMRDIWTKCGEVSGENVIPATEYALALRGSSYDDAFREFTVWNFFTNTRANTSQFYSEGNLFNGNSRIQPVIGEFYSSYPVDKDSVTHPPENLGSNYIWFYPTSSPGGLKMYFDGDDNADWRVSVIGYKSGSPTWIKELNLDILSKNGWLSLYNWTLYDDIVMIPAVVTKYAESFNFGYSDTFYSGLDAGIEKDQSLPHKLCLGQNYPNPFNPSTTIPFTVSYKGQGAGVKSPIPTSLIIYNILGQRVRRLVDEVKLPGEYEIIWDGKDDKGNEVTSGIYFYKLQTKNFSQTKKMLLVK